MKEVTYIVGLLSSIAVSLGFLFRLMQWPGGGVLSVWGTFGFGFLFLPLFAIYYFRSKQSKLLSERLKMITGVVSGIIFTLSVLFKSLHLQGGDMLLIAGVLLFAFTFLPLFFFSLYRNAPTSEA